MKALSNKRRFLAAFTAALLISAALVASCIDQIEERYGGNNGSNNDDNIVIPEGKGLVRISVSSPRTILPDNTARDVNALFYTVAITGPSTLNIPATGTTAVSYGALTAPTALTAGNNYTIVITAYNNSNTSIATTKAVAGVTITGVNVTSGTSTSASGNLKGIIIGDGTFSYDITVPAIPTGFPATFFTLTTAPIAYNAHKIEIFDNTPQIVDEDKNGTPIGTSGVITLPNTGSTHNTGSYALPAGYYTVKITLTATNCLDRVVEQVLHVYNGMTSNWTYSVPVLSQNLFAASFTPVQTVTNPGSVTLTDQVGKTNGALLSNPGNPTAAGYIFNGWYDGSNPWNFASTPILKDTALVAHWTASTGVTVSITWDVATLEVAVTGNGTSYEALKGSSSITLTASDNNTIPGALTNVEWFLEGDSIGSGNPLIIDSSFAHFELLTIGRHVVRVTADVDDDPDHDTVGELIIGQ